VSVSLEQLLTTF